LYFRIWKRISVLSDLLKDHLFFGKLPTLLLIAVNEIVVDGDLKDATMSLFQGRSCAEIVFDCGRQTGCRGKETSFYTVGDFNSKGLLSFVIHDGLL
jgi:hypothetical protein